MKNTVARHWMVIGSFGVCLLSGTAFSRDASLAGTVTFADGTKVEGVVIKASKSGSPIATSVVTGTDGSYSFPRSNVGAGEYAVTVRATGFDLGAKKTVRVQQIGMARLDLVLQKAADVAPQLNNAEWLLSAPGTEEQKAQILLCVSCHTYERIFTSTHDVTEFESVITRMVGYTPGTTPMRPQVRPNQTFDHPERFEGLATYLSTINLSASKPWAYSFKILPRPKGRETHVIVTEYQLPRPDMQPHDVVLDKDGTPWYADFGQQYVASLDPATGKVKEYPVPVPRPTMPTGMLDVRFDKDNNLWAGMMLQTAIVKMDVRTGKMQTYSAPASEMKDDTLQIPMIAPENMGVDGKIWMDVVSTRAFHGVQRLNLETGEFEQFDIFNDSAEHKGGGASIGEGEAPARDFWGLKVPSSNTYDIATDSLNNVYFSDFADSPQARIGRVVAKTGKIEWFFMPTVHARPRRMSMDSKDQLWIAEYRGNKIAMFDTRTSTFKEWQMPPGTYPYDVMVDKYGDVWTSGEHTDRIVRLNPSTNEILQYLLPSTTDVRRIYVDSSTKPVTVWVGNNHEAAIVRVQPLD